MSVYPKFGGYAKETEVVFQNVDLSHLLSHSRMQQQQQVPVPIAHAVPIADEEDPQHTHTCVPQPSVHAYLWNLLPETGERPICNHLALQLLHVLVCSATVWYFEMCVFGYSGTDTMLLLPLAAYLGWHSRVAAHAAQDLTCLYSGIMTAMWCGFAYGRVLHSYTIFSLSVYFAAHMLQRDRVYPMLCVGVVHIMFFGLSVVLPDAKVVLCVWGVLVYAMGLAAMPRCLQATA